MRIHPGLTELHGGGSFFEGPRWYEGGLYFSDFFTNRVLRWRNGVVGVIAEVPGQPSGIGFDREGNLMVVSMAERRVLRVRGARIETFADLSAHTASLCNDMLVDSNGRAYVGSFGWDLAASERICASDLLLADSTGAVTVAATGLVFPNGMALTADGGTLLIAETFAARISAFDVRPDGGLTGRRTLISFAEQPFETVAQAVSSGAILPDGIALDRWGNLWVGSAVGNALLRVSPEGKVSGRVEIGELTPFAVAVGGADGEQLFICADPPMGSCDPSVERRAKLLMCDLREFPRDGL